jgi:hypothetical protein
MADGAWERVTSTYLTINGRIRRRPHTVYWNRKLADGRRLTVARRYRDGQPLNEWRWAVYPATKRVVGGRSVALAAGECANVPQGRRRAEAAAGIVVPPPG